MRKVLITGATGFVGSHALEAISSGETIKVIVACRNQSHLPQGIKGEVRIGDVRDEAYLGSLFEDVDAVCNAFASAWLMEVIDHVVPWEPLVTRSIIHLLREVNVDNQSTEEFLGYIPEYDWREAVRSQLAEMSERQKKPMRMARPNV